MADVTETPNDQGGRDVVVQGFAPTEGGITQQGTRTSPVPRRYEEARAHVESCDEDRATSNRLGSCPECGATVSYDQTTCAHGQLLVGTCSGCGTVYDRAGWINRNKPAAV